MSQHSIGLVQNSFICDDGFNIMEYTLSEIIVMKEIVEEVYGESSFFEVAGKNINILFKEREEEAESKVKKSL